MASTMAYTEAQLGYAGSNPIPPSGPNNDPGVQPSETDGDALSTTLTIRTGYTSTYNPNAPQLSRLSRHSIKIKTSSSFPNLLSLYQTPIKEETSEKSPRKPRRQKRERKKKDATTEKEQEDAHDRRHTQEYRRLRIDAVAKEQLDRFDNYVSSMHSKVEKQREERKKYNETLQERLREQEEMEKKKLRLHRGPKHQFVNDTSFQKTLPVSKYCKAARLADQLQRKGVLRTRGDVEKYWSGFAEKQRDVKDIFNDDASSVNFPSQWMGVRNPEIRIEEEDEGMTEAPSMRQLPPLKPAQRKRKKKKAHVIDIDEEINQEF